MATSAKVSPSQRLANALFAPVDIASLVFFRIFFGAMMLWTIWDFFAKDLIASLFVNPPFHFTYHGFSWLKPWPGNGMYLHFAALAVLSVFVIAGFVYRLSALLLCVGFTYVFLLEKAIFLNHFYLMCLLCFLLVFLPAHRAWSVDVLLRRRLRSSTVPAWTLWLLRFQIALPYVYGGFAKLKSDWLQGQPMQMWLSISPWRVVLGPVAEEHWLALLFSWGGLIFDLSIVPLLLWKRTRTLAFVLVVLFHLQNAFMFDIGVFPWLMIGATTVFFAADWPRRLLTPRRSEKTTQPKQPPTPRAAEVIPSKIKRRTVVVLLAFYVTLQLIVPFRRWLYPGNVMWTEQGYLFSWQMMLWAKVNAIRFIVTDRQTGQTVPVDIGRWLTSPQIERMGHDPEMLREFAHFLRERHEDQGQDVAVHVMALSSLNGRKPQLLIDPTADLSRQRRTWLHQIYILPLVERFRRAAWNVPVAEWEKVLANPGRAAP